ncbi:hypothetical protein BHE74_00040719 [Ensete ventricosum]|nr:hypothetical protein BHE74_00040719 [Ensete ventricosum]
MLLNFWVVLRCRSHLILVEYVNSFTSIRIRIFDFGWDRLSEVSTLASARSFARLLRSAPASWILHKGLVSGGGCPTLELVCFMEKGCELLSFSRSLVRERERDPHLVLLKRDFILTGEEVDRTFDLTPVVTSSMVESYRRPVGAVVWVRIWCAMQH